MRILEGHKELVRCIRFDGKRIVSGAYDGYVTCGVATRGHRPFSLDLLSSVCLDTAELYVLYCTRNDTLSIGLINLPPTTTSS